MAKKEVKTNKENNKNKKSFFKGFKAELKKVIWPTPRQLVNNTIAVVTVVLITAAIVFVLDLAFETVNKQGIEKVKEIVGTTNSVSEESEQTTDETEEPATNAEEGETSSEETEDQSEEETPTEEESQEQGSEQSGETE